MKLPEFQPWQEGLTPGFSHKSGDFKFVRVLQFIRVNGRKLRVMAVAQANRIANMEFDERGGFVMDLRDRCDA